MDQPAAVPDPSPNHDPPSIFSLITAVSQHVASPDRPKGKTFPALHYYLHAANHAMTIWTGCPIPLKEQPLDS